MWLQQLWIWNCHQLWKTVMFKINFSDILPVWSLTPEEIICRSFNWLISLLGLLLEDLFCYKRKYLKQSCFFKIFHLLCDLIFNTKSEILSSTLRMSWYNRLNAKALMRQQCCNFFLCESKTVFLMLLIYTHETLEIWLIFAEFRHLVIWSEQDSIWKLISGKLYQNELWFHFSPDFNC